MPGRTTLLTAGLIAGTIANVAAAKDYPQFKDVAKDYEEVVSTADGSKPLYGLYIDKNDVLYSADSESNARRIVELPDPRLGPEEVLIDVHYVGLCGSDLGMYRGTFAIGTYPRIPGHEVSGVIVATGEAVPGSIEAGQRVTLWPYSECGVCPACRVGRPNSCQFNETLGLQRDGAMVERFAIHYSQVFASDILTLEELALVEPMSVGYHAAKFLQEEDGCKITAIIERDGGLMDENGLDVAKQHRVVHAEAVGKLAHRFGVIDGDADELHGVGSRHVLENDPEGREAVRQWRQRGVDKALFPVVDVHVGIGALTVYQQGQTQLAHACQCVVTALDARHSGVRMRGRTSGVEFDAVNDTGLTGFSHVLRARVIRQIEGHQRDKVGIGR